MWLILTTFLITSAKEVHVNYAEIAPTIDGVIEDVWQKADSAYGFVQFMPYEQQPPSERTVVYVLQDKYNIYFAFRCWAEKHKPVACLTRDEEYVSVGIDPFDSKTNGYFFTVFGSRIVWDGWIHDDGQSQDQSWEGVWFRDVTMHDNYYEVEFKIPFKSIRYKKGLERWGVQFMRYTAAELETDYWTEVTQDQGDRVSRWGSLVGVNPQSTGYYFELYPEGYVRYDKEEGVDAEYKPRMSMNAKWDITPQTTLNATAFPDFAQIESDPFTLNLGRYPVYLAERRPFFVEGMDAFRLAHLGDGPFTPLDIFYSRRIGKSLNGDVVPIIGGGKLTSKAQDWNFGVLGAYTGEYSRNDTVLETEHGFGAVRAKRRLLGNSEVGVLLDGSMVDQDDYNVALATDLVLRRGARQFITHGAVSDKDGKRGWALSSGYHGFIGKYQTNFAGAVINDSFDVSDIGFVPWVGHKELVAAVGPLNRYRSGAMSTLYYGPGLSLSRSPGSRGWSKHGFFEVNPSFRNGWGFDANLDAGPSYEMDTSYFSRSASLHFWGRFFGNLINGSLRYGYQYNYQRGFIANSGSSTLTLHYAITENLRVGAISNVWVEWDTTGTLLAMTPLFRPNVGIVFNADMNLTVFSEIVMATPGAEIGETEVRTARTGVLYSWNFRPKSWIYIALNDYRADDLAQPGTDMQLLYQIGAVKAKYLLYF